MIDTLRRDPIKWAMIAFNVFLLCDAAWAGDVFSTIVAAVALAIMSRVKPPVREPRYRWKPVLDPRPRPHHWHGGCPNVRDDLQ